MTNKQFSVSVVGGGAVGRATAAFYKKSAKIYDKYRPVDPIDEIAKADYIFIAVPTPYQGKGGQDLTEMDDAVATVVEHLIAPERQVIIIKSTVVPGTTDAYQQRYPAANFVFSPEFLTESMAFYDFAHPDKQLVGYTDKTKDIASKVLEILPNAPYKNIFPAKVCEMAKYAINTYYAFKVIFGNCLYDLCEKLQIDYNIVHEGVAADKRIIDTHFDVFHGGYRGFDGKCLPKDVKTLAWLGRRHKADLEFIEEIIKINQSLLKINKK